MRSRRMRSRRGRITLLEVVVALFAIGLLMSLLLPVLQVSRTEGSRSVCGYNMRNCGMSLLQVHELQRAFPGYANLVGGKRASWVVTILPQLERNDLYQNWNREELRLDLRSKQAGGNRELLISSMYPMQVLVCPSDDAAWDRRSDNPLSYVVNSGSARSASDFRPPIVAARIWIEDPASGVFFNRAHADYDTTIRQPSPRPPASAFAPKNAPAMTLDYVASHDGAEYTLLLSENVQAGEWATDPLTPSQPLQSEFQMRQSVAFVWFVTGQADNTAPPTSAVLAERGFDPESMRINGRLSMSEPLPVEFLPGEQRGGLAAARPSGHHLGGVNVMYCGGNGGYLSEDIDYRVYTQLMTPNGQEVVVDLDAGGNPIRASAASGTSPRVATPWVRTFNPNEL